MTNTLEKVKAVVNMDGQIDPEFPVLITAKFDASMYDKVKNTINGEHQQTVPNYKMFGLAADLSVWNTARDRLLAKPYARFAFINGVEEGKKIMEATFTNMDAVNHFFSKLGEAHLAPANSIQTKTDARTIFGLMEDLLAVGRKQDRGVAG